MTVWMWFLGWLCSAVSSYVAFRYLLRAEYGKYTRGDRAFNLLVSIFSPVATVVVLCMILLDLIADFCKWDAEAKW